MNKSIRRGEGGEKDFRSLEKRVWSENTSYLTDYPRRVVIAARRSKQTFISTMQIQII